MNKYEIYVDSGNNIPDELLEKYDINVVPFTCTIDGKETDCYEKGVPFKQTAVRFYEALRAGADIKTSLIGAAKFAEYVAPALTNGKDVIIFTISSGISGTYNQAVAAQKELAEKYPDRKIIVRDSANASMGSGMQAIKAAELRDEGESVENCDKWFEENGYKFNSYVTVGDLKYLRKGGRVSAVAAIAGTILNIKPILHANETSPANLTVCAKERGKKKALAYIANAYSQRAENVGNDTVYICHADSVDDANELAQMIKDRGAKEVILEYYDLCTGSHVGPGTVALFFFGKDRRTYPAN